MLSEKTIYRLLRLFLPIIVVPIILYFSLSAVFDDLADFLTRENFFENS